MRIIFITVLTLTVLLINTAAQDRIVTGMVTAFENIPLLGANIKVRSTKQVTLTDSTGGFTITCPGEETIRVSAKGFYTQKIILNPANKFIAVNLKIRPGEKNREYAIGYGKVSDRDKLYAASNLTESDLDFSSYSSIYDLIHSRFAGVEVKNGEIIIRGTQSFMGSNSALIIVDGMPADNGVLSGIHPKEVKSIDVLRDGGASVYGSRGANGVVIIETK